MADTTEFFTEARISLSPEHLKQVKELKVGGKVRLVLYGTLKGIEQSQDDNSNEEGADRGSLTMTVSQMRTASNNEIADLFDDEFDD